MRKSSDIIREINNLKRVLLEASKLKKQEKHIPAIIQLSFEQDEKRYAQLLDELQAAYRQENKHVFKFIIKNIEAGTPVNIDRFFQSVTAFQRLMQDIGKELFNVNNSLLNLSFANTFKSSFGVLLSTEQADSELISKSYNTLESMFSTLTQLNDDSDLNSFIKDALQRKNLLRKYRRFYHVQARLGNSVQLVWGDTQNTNVAVSITKERFQYISESLAKYEAIPDQKITGIFTIKGISLVKKRLELEYPDTNKIIRPRCNDVSVLVDAGKKINQPTKFTINIVSKINDMTDDVEKEYFIV